jgi:hypothetical protein
MRARKVREIIGVIVALILIVLFAAIGAAVAGWQVPGLINITDLLGITGG